MISLVTKCYSDDQKEDEMVDTCGTYGGEEKGVQGFGCKT